MIQTDLPNTPADVIDIWLEQHSKRDNFGWPPTPDSEWHFVLREQNGLEYLQSLRWSIEEIELKPSILYPDDMKIITDLFKAYVIGEKNMYTHMLNSKDRFRSCCDYLIEHGIFPKPIVLEATDAGLKVLDGNHRLLAFFYLYGFFKIENDETPCLKVETKQKTWVANQQLATRPSI